MVSLRPENLKNSSLIELQALTDTFIIKARTLKRKLFFEGETNPHSTQNKQGVVLIEN
jgi:hypothetical protein